MAVEQNSPSRGNLAIIVATAAVTVALGVTIAALGGYLRSGRDAAPQEPVVEAVAAPAPAQPLAPEQAPAPAVAADPAPGLLLASDPPVAAGDGPYARHDDDRYDGHERGHARHQHDDDEDDDGDD